LRIYRQVEAGQDIDEGIQAGTLTEEGVRASPGYARLQDYRSSPMAQSVIQRLGAKLPQFEIAPGPGPVARAVEPYIPEKVLDIAGRVQPYLAGRAEEQTFGGIQPEIVPQEPETTYFGPYKYTASGEEVAQRKRTIGGLAGMFENFAIFRSPIARGCTSH
jgi:hypothetical protein